MRQLSSMFQPLTKTFWKGPISFGMTLLKRLVSTFEMPL